MSDHFGSLTSHSLLPTSFPKTKKERTKPIHPRSRAAEQQARRGFHDQKVDKRYKEKSQKLEALGERLKWFQDNIDENKPGYTKQEAYDLIIKYLDRFKEELEQIRMLNSMKGRSGSQHFGREQAIAMTTEMEQREFDAPGFEIPDLINHKNCKTFREWGGELRYIPNLKLRKILRSDCMEDSRKEADTALSGPAEPTGASPGDITHNSTDTDSTTASPGQPAVTEHSPTVNTDSKSGDKTQDTDKKFDDTSTDVSME